MVAPAILIGGFAGLMPAVPASRIPSTVHEREVDLYGVARRSRPKTCWLPGPSTGVERPSSR